jgi:outer membrane protein TolC
MKNIVLTVCMCIALGAYSQQTTKDTLSVYESEIEYVKRILTDQEVLDSLIVQAIESSNILKSYEAEIHQNSENVKQQKRKWISSFRVGLNLYSSATTLDENNNSVTTQGILPNTGLTLSIDPEKFVNRRSYIRYAEHEKERAQQRYLDQKKQVEAWIVNQYYQYLNSLESIVIRTGMLDVRRQNYVLIETEFKQGKIDYSTLMVAQNNVYLAEEALIQVQIDARKKKREIDVFLK